MTMSDCVVMERQRFEDREQAAQDAQERELNALHDEALAALKSGDPATRVTDDTAINGSTRVEYLVSDYLGGKHEAVAWVELMGLLKAASTGDTAKAKELADKIINGSADLFMEGQE
jgi:hypothetical protein